MVELSSSFPPVDTNEQNIASEALRCLCLGDYWDQLRPLLQTGFPYREFSAAIRHEVQYSHQRNGLVTAGVELPSIEDLLKLTTVELGRRNLLRLFIISPFRNPREAVLAAFPEVEEEARYQQRLISSTQTRGQALEVIETLQTDLPLSQAEKDNLAIAELKAGNTEALGQIYEDYQNKIYHFVLARLGDPYLAENLSQETFIRVFLGIKTYEDQGLRLSAWIFRIAHNLVIDHVRHNKIRPTENAPLYLIEKRLSISHELADDLDNKMEIRLLHEAITKLTSRQQGVLRMRLQDMKYSEIAAKLGLAEGTVKSTISQSISRLREILGDEPNILRGFSL
ncbi:MAG: RNA polymerase sigma factor [Candidatus Daviesbacteria bacterium]|nr:RNA polymerase sigma factor [Candidatus Daviesbacteria bacterium]